LYVVVSYTRAHGHVIRPGLSLVQAYHLIARLGHGAIFRAEGMSIYARPIYPVLPRTPEPARINRASGRAANVIVRTQGRVA
jgi:hypothetical protein